MNSVLEEWNKANAQEATAVMLACCGARRWADRMVASRPLAGVAALSEAADRIWGEMSESDWLEAFACHPHIGEFKAASASERSNAWSQQEQAGTGGTPKSVMAELAAGNALYEQRFGFTYIVCATGRSADEMLAILTRRLGNDRMPELKEAAEQQRQIMQIRLGKWLLS